jgi:2'-5' RNA ligase
MRAFIAISISDKARGKCQRVIEELQASGADLKPVRPENLHVTLMFLGEVGDADLDKVRAVLREFSAKEKAFRISLSMLGYFGNARFPRTVWIGISEGRQEISRICREMNRMLAGIREDSREPRPHLTLARVKSVRGAESLLEKIRELRDVNIGEVEVKEIKLMRSMLQPSGPVYSELESFPLGRSGK